MMAYASIAQGDQQLSNAVTTNSINQESTPLPTGATLLYGLGGAVYAVKEAAYVVFILLFYTQVLGLSGASAGIVLFIGLIWDAISDPMIGVWSDRFKSRWGRRLPFMLAGAIPLGIGFVGLFSPPTSVVGDELSLGLWLLFWSVWVRTAVTMFSIPQLAMVAEITSDYNERSRLISYRMGFMFLTTVLLPAISMMLIFGESNGEDGRFDASRYPMYGWLSCMVVWLAAAGTIWGGNRAQTQNKLATDDVTRHAGLMGMLRDFTSTLKIPNFRNLLFYDLAASASYGVLVTLSILAWTYYWELDSTQVSIVLALPSVMAVPLAIWLLGPVSRRWSKHQILNTAIALMLLDAGWVYGLRVYDLIPENGHPLVFALLFLQMFLWMFFFVFRGVASLSIAADITDEHELATGQRSEGGLFSALTFTTKLASAIGPLYGGVVLDIIDLREGMMPGDISQSTLDGLAIAMAMGIMPMMALAWYFSSRVSMSRERLQDIHAQLAAKKVQ